MKKMTVDTFEYIFHNIPTHLLNYNGLRKNDPFGLITHIGEELDRRSPGPLPVQYDSDGNEIKAELIGYDREGNEIWLDMYQR